MQPWCIITYKKRSSKFDLTDETSREMWDTWDPTLISEVNIPMNTIWGNFDTMGQYGQIKCRAIETFRIIYNRAQGLFAAANIFSSLKLVYIFSVNPYLGPLQVIWHALLIVKVANFLSGLFLTMVGNLFVHLILSLQGVTEPDDSPIMCNYAKYTKYAKYAKCAKSARYHWAWWSFKNVQICNYAKYPKYAKICEIYKI